jgi:hypothetical protein
LIGADPVAGGEACELRAVKAGARTIIEILDHRITVFELRELQEARHAPILSMQLLAVEQEREPLLEREALRGGVRHLLGQCECHPMELQAV